jgi:hypothetical protein
LKREDKYLREVIPGALNTDDGLVVAAIQLIQKLQAQLQQVFVVSSASSSTGNRTASSSMKKRKHNNK